MHTVNNLYYRTLFVLSLFFFFFLMLRPPPRSTLFTYTTLFRSQTKSGLNPVPVIDCVPPFPEYVTALKLFANVVLLRSEEHTSELQSPCNIVCRLLLEKKKIVNN